MPYVDQIPARLHDPAGLEALYREAAARNQETAFVSAVDALYQASPDDILLAAWHHRLAQPQQAGISGAGMRWRSVVLLGLLLSAFTFVLTDSAILGSTYGQQWAPLWIMVLAALALSAYLVVGGKQPRRWPLTVAAVLCALAGYATVFTLIAARSRIYPFVRFAVHEQYLTLALIHIAGAAVLSVIWAAVGHRSETGARHAALVRAVEVAITAGLFSAMGGFVLMLGVGLFSALGINLNTELFTRAMASLAVGYVPLLAMTTLYDPRVSPNEQDFTRGFSKILAVLLRIMLPVGLVGLLVYAAVIPFHFWEPFNNRDVLIIYNVLLFAVVGLVVGATPLRVTSTDPKQSRWLRLGLLILAGLTTLVSLYALAAVTYRTALSGFTANRLTVIGWNIVNISLLVVMFIRLLRSKQDDWIGAVSRTIHSGLVTYSAWTAFLIIALPLLFR
ncbi:MAG: hypothetical protein LLG44_06210 [Chloroflexi bacterium]|nr:hypothetical protein [Chloroflexota bacterium]